MKVALCFSGQPRFYNSKSFESIKKFILDKYDCDIFFHFWLSKDENYEYSSAPWSNIKDKISFSKDTQQSIIDLYKPKNFIFEEPKEFKEFIIESDYLSKNMPSMFYSMKASNELRLKYQIKSEKKYDWIIRIRSDTFLESFPDLYSLNNNILYVPDNCGNPELYNDNFSICGGNVLNIVYNVFDSIKEYSNGENYSPEYMWFTHLKKNNIPIVKLNFVQNFSRSN